MKFFLLINVKDYLPHLFHGFRNKYFNKNSLDNMLNFPKELVQVLDNACFFDNMVSPGSSVG